MPAKYHRIIDPARLTSPVRKALEKQIKATEKRGRIQREAIEEEVEKKSVIINYNVKKDDDGFFAYNRDEGRDNKTFLRQKMFEEIYDRRTARTNKVYNQINFYNPMYKYRANLNVILKNWKSKRFF